MIIYKEGNILEAKADALVNTVNTVGVMGKGIALQFKNAFPENFKVYSEAAKKKEIQLGKVQVVPVNNVLGVKYVINFPTKGHWRYPSKIEWIIEGLKDLVQQIQKYNITSIALPPLGCGNGGLNWKEVKPIIEDALKNLQTTVYIYEPSASIKEALKKEERKSASKLTAPRAMLLSLLYQYRALGELASEFAAEKLTYFLQRFGESQLKLNFQKGIYGPYSGKVRHVLYALNGYYLKGYEQKEAKPFEELEMVVSKKPEVLSFIDQELGSAEKARLENVSKFIEGFESPYGLELLATVDFLIEELKTTNEQNVLEGLKQWSSRKESMFSKSHIKLAINHLVEYKDLLYKEVVLN